MGSNPVILIVDDDPLNVRLLSTILRRIQCETIEARNGYDALEKVKEKVPDLILLDITMPGMNGYEVIANLKKDPETKDIPVIFVTALSGEDNKGKGLEAGAADYIEKPVNTKRLLKKVESLLFLNI